MNLPRTTPEPDTLRSRTLYKLSSDAPADRLQPESTNLTGQVENRLAPLPLEYGRDSDRGTGQDVEVRGPTSGLSDHGDRDAAAVGVGAVLPEVDALPSAEVAAAVGDREGQ